jgi:hypothetical protein
MPLATMDVWLYCRLDEETASLMANLGAYLVPTTITLLPSLFPICRSDEEAASLMTILAPHLVCSPVMLYVNAWMG